MKILHLVFHPNLESSRVNSTWKQQLEASGKVTTTRDVYADYPDFNIDVEREHADLVAHDRIVLQFPLYWYSMPPLLKKWLDDVLVFNFAYGTKGDKLVDKELQVILSVGARAKFHSGFDIFTSIPDLLRPFQMTANMVRMKYLVPEWMHEANTASFEVIEQYGKQWVDMIDDPNRSNARDFLYGNYNTLEVDKYFEDVSADAVG